jgi:hypothetical protein
MFVSLQALEHSGSRKPSGSDDPLVRRHNHGTVSQKKKGLHRCKPLI